MAVYEVEAPDGKILEIEGPEGAKPEQIFAAARQLYKPNSQTPRAPRQEQTTLPPAAPVNQFPTGGAAVDSVLAPDSMGTGMPSAADIMGVVTPPATVLEGMTFDAPTVDPVANRQAMERSRSPGSVMFTPGRQQRKLDQQGKLAQALAKAGFATIEEYYAAEAAAKRRQDFTAENPNLGALGSGAAQALQGSLNIPSAAASFVNKTFVDPFLSLAGTKMPEVPTAPGTETLGRMQSDYMPAVGKLPLEQAWEQNVFGDWLAANVSAQVPQMLQTVGGAVSPAVRSVVLPGMGATAAGSSFAQGDDARIAVTKGVLEVLSEGASFGVADKVKDVLRALPAPVQQSVFRAIAQKSLAVGGALTAQQLAGAIEESVAKMGNNALDNFAGGKPTELLAGVPDSAVVGAATNTVMALPNVAEAARNNSPKVVAARELAKLLEAGELPAAQVGPDLNRNLAQDQGQPRDRAPAPAAPAAPAVATGPQPEAPAAPVQSAPVSIAEPAPAADVRRVSTLTGRQIDTRLKVVDAGTLIPAGGELQPRDRARAASDEQINTIASELDPARLGDSAEADRGAPIVGPDGVIESGNGRVQAIQWAAERYTSKYQTYLDFLKAQGYSVEGMKTPVLVRERITPLSPADRIAFVQEANQSATMALSPVEQAKIDVSAMADNVVNVWAGGDVSDMRNRDFVSAFVGNLPQAQRNGLMAADGSLSPDGATRIRRAMLATAYDDADLLAKLMESTDESAKSVGNALFDASGGWIQMRRMAKAGTIPAQYDVTRQLVSAAQTADQLRRTRTKARDWLDQMPLEGERDDVVDAFVRAFYNTDLDAAVRREAIGEVLQAYIAEAKRQDTQDLLGDAPPPPAPIIDQATKARNENRDAKSTQTALLEADPPGAGRAGPRLPEGGDKSENSRVAEDRAGSGEQGDEDEPLSRGTRRGSKARAPSAGAGNQAEPGTLKNERATVPGRFDAKAEAPDRQPAARDTEPAKNQRVKGAQAGNKFKVASFTNRQAVYKDAYIDLGLDPDKSMLLPPEQQFRILSEGFKKKFGLSAVAKSNPANIRESIDQLLDGYRGLQLMSAALDLPATAMGLNGTLGLGLISTGKNFLGAYFPKGSPGSMTDKMVTSGPTIAMPGRSNSFSHEWGHALDYYIADKYQGATADLSGLVRGGKTLSDQFPESVADSFRLLMNSLFFDQSAMAGRIFDLERKIELAKQKGQGTKAAEAELAKLKSGSSQSPAGRSDYYKNSNEFANKMMGNAPYWRSPTEMLARSFEAYMAHKVEAIGGTTEFITKGDYAYTSDAEDRLALTFPKDADRRNIFRAYDLLFDAIRAETMLNPHGLPAQGVPPGERIADPLAHYDATLKSTFSERTRAGLQAEIDAFKQRRREINAYASRPKEPRSVGALLVDATGALVHTNRGVLLSLEARYKRHGNKRAADEINQVIRKLATDPGSARGTAAEGTFAEAVWNESNQRLNRLGNIVRSNGLQEYTPAEQAELTRALTNTGDDIKGISPKILKAATQLRNLMDGTYYYNKNAGLDVGYVADTGYLPRMLDEPVVAEKAEEFIKDAKRVYEIVFERDTERPGAEGGDIAEAIDALMARMKEASIQPKKDSDYDDFMKARAKLRKLLRAAENAEDGDDIDAAQAELNKFIEENLDIFIEAYERVKDAWSQQAAEEYQSRILFNSPLDFGLHSPGGSFLKGRKLPAEAERILGKYYIADPVERISRYIQASVRKSEYERRFGGGKLKKHFDGMRAAEVSSRDQSTIQAIIDQVAGTDISRMPRAAQRLIGNVHAVGNMTLLGRVVLTSLAEQATIAMQTGKFLDTFRATALLLREAVNTKAVREQRAIADLLGVVSSDMSQEVVSNRLGGTHGEGIMMQRVSSRFFRNVGLTGLTNAQRRVSMQLAGKYFMELAADVRDADASANSKARAREELIDFGLTAGQVDDFAAWAESFARDLPSYRDLADEATGELTEMGRIYGLMVGRLTNQAVQNPTAIDRPWAANTIIGRMTFGLLSFTMAMSRNVMLKSVKKIQREYENRGAASATKVAALQVVAPMLALYTGHLLVTIAREALLNPDKWEEEEKKEGGPPVKWLMQLAFSRAGFTGLTDPIYNALLGVKYQRDLANILAGPGNGYFLQAIERVAKFFLTNSKNTNAAERNAVRGLYEAILMPTAAVGVGYLPAGPMLGLGLGAAYAYLSSPRAKGVVQDAVVGPADTKKSKTGETAGNKGVW
jgi:hypothetical protein